MPWRKMQTRINWTCKKSYFEKVIGAVHRNSHSTFSTLGTLKWYCSSWIIDLILRSSISVLTDKLLGWGWMEVRKTDSNRSVDLRNY